MKAIEISAKSVEKAIEDGLKQLGVTQDQVDIKILDEGGFFRKAKVLLSLEGTKEEEIKAEISITKDASKATVKAEKKTGKTASKEKSTDLKKTNSETKATTPAADSIKTPSSQLSTTAKESAQAGTNFLKGLFKQLKIDANIDIAENEQGVTFYVTGGNASELIGHRGETLNSLQYILSIVAKTKDSKGTRIYLDIEGYKSRREESLNAMALRMAEKCKKIGKPMRLDPMNAYERKVIHTALQQDVAVTTKSEGEEPRRYLVIIPKK